MVFLSQRKCIPVHVQEVEKTPSKHLFDFNMFKNSLLFMRVKKQRVNQSPDFSLMVAGDGMQLFLCLRNDEQGLILRGDHYYLAVF